MIACYKGHYKIASYLLALGANVNRRSFKGNTALHDCAESGSLEILQLLLAHGALMDVDSYGECIEIFRAIRPIDLILPQFSSSAGMTPLLAASVTGHLPIVEHLISLATVSREDRIAALELLGATFVDKKRDMLSALSFWRRAMEDRYGQEPKIPKVIQVPSHAAYDYVQEVNDFNALDELVMDPDEMRMQALVIRERILGPAHPDTSYYIRYRGAVYADAGRFDRCIELWTYALTMQQSILEPLSPMTQSSLLSFAELFSFMLGEAGRPVTRGRIVPPIDSNDMILVFDKALQEVRQGQEMLQKFPEHDRDTSALSRALVSALHIACLLARLLVTTTTAVGENGVAVVQERIDLDCMTGIRAEELSKEELDIRRRVLKALHELVSLKVSGRIDTKDGLWRNYYCSSLFAGRLAVGKNCSAPGLLP